MNHNNNKLKSINTMNVNSNIWKLTKSKTSMKTYEDSYNQWTYMQINENQYSLCKSLGIHETHEYQWQGIKIHETS